MRRLIIGGARSGKSRFAETLLSDAPAEYVATSWADPSDAEWTARVRAHVARRPASWTTTETLDVAAVLGRVAPEPVLVDCLTVWLSRVMDECGCWPEPVVLNPPPSDPPPLDPPPLDLSAAVSTSGAPPSPAPDGGSADRAVAEAGNPAGALASRIDELVAAVASTARDVVLVTNEVGQGIVPATASGRLFRDEMGVLNLRVAAACDEVWLVTAGIPQRIKG